MTKKLPQFNKPSNVMETTDAQHYESQTERDETKYLHQMEGSNFAT